MVVVSASEVVVLPVGRDVGLDSRVTVETANIARSGTKVPRFSLNVTICQDGEDGEDS